MYYYINVLYFYSLFGFILESTVYKIQSVNKHSSIFYGPITMVYGFGVLILTLVKRYFFDKLRCNKYFKLFIVFISSWIILTTTEWLGGTILNLVFKIDMWDYSDEAFNLGKYVCLKLSFIWAVLGTAYIYFLKDFFDKVINLIPKKLTITIVIVNFIDLLLVLFNKIP